MLSTRTLDRKKVLRRINKCARNVNNGIKDDSLWRGRFYMRQTHCSLYNFEDGSGMWGFVCYEFIDIKTGITRENRFAISQFLEHDFAWAMNDFIVEYRRVWEKEGRDALRADNKIYRTDNSIPKKKGNK